MTLSESDFFAAVRGARAIAEAETQGLCSDPAFPSSFDDRSGAFVTVREHPSGALRGCIGYMDADMPLRESLHAAARGVCRDPRFERLTFHEAERCTFEVTVLSPSEMVRYESPEDLLSKIDLGEDGISMHARIDGRRYSAVFLPQVPVEQGWSKEEYLANLCLKAGLYPDEWKRGRARFSRFRGTAYAETSPRGEVVKK